MWSEESRGVTVRPSNRDGLPVGRQGSFLRQDDRRELRFMNQESRETNLQGVPPPPTETTMVSPVPVAASQPGYSSSTTNVESRSRSDIPSTAVLDSARTITPFTHLSGTTDLFIKEGYEFKIIDGMITNFHVPKSSLLMLVAAFVGREKLFDLYKQAIDKKFKFFSFGDGMLLY